MTRRRATKWVLILIVTHLAMQAFAATKDSITVDEIPTLAAGLSHWTTGNFGLAKVNPPLVRLVASAPVLVFGELPEGWLFPAESIERLDHRTGARLIQQWGEISFTYFTIARLPVLGFSALGAFICYLWARDLFGEPAGLAACVLWCFSPFVLTHGHLITTDVAATTTGLAANYLFWKWLRTTASTEGAPRSSWHAALTAGFVLGLAELTKTTWVILYLAWPSVWALWSLVADSAGMKTRSREALQLLAALFLAIYVTNLGYGFEGTGKPLGDFTFRSTTLTLENGFGDRVNRFSGTVLGAVPVPFPRNYVQGIDMQKQGFEQSIHMYLHGTWKTGGWWYYYLYGALYKIPLGGLYLFAISCVLLIATNRDGMLWKSLLVLGLPALMVFVLASSQTAINRHTRYILPCMPFFYVVSSGVFSKQVGEVLTGLPYRGVFRALLTWFVVSSVWIYPHSTTYFNEFAGGPFNGPKLILGSSVDWGQDLLYLKQWTDANPQAQPLGVVYGLWRIHPRLAGIEKHPVPPGMDDERLQSDSRFGPQPGWYAVAIKRILDRHQTYRYFLDFQPIDYAGYSIYIYHLSEEDVRRYWDRKH